MARRAHHQGGDQRGASHQPQGDQAAAGAGQGSVKAAAAVAVVHAGQVSSCRSHAGVQEPVPPRTTEELEGSVWRGDEEVSSAVPALACEGVLLERLSLCSSSATGCCGSCCRPAIVPTKTASCGTASSPGGTRWPYDLFFFFLTLFHTKNHLTYAFHIYMCFFLFTLKKTCSHSLCLDHQLQCNSSVSTSGSLWPRWFKTP